MHAQLGQILDQKIPKKKKNPAAIYEELGAKTWVLGAKAGYTCPPALSMFLEHTKHIPASGPLYLLFSLHFPDISIVCLSPFSPLFKYYVFREVLPKLPKCLPAPCPVYCYLLYLM